jgi:GntR family transcriptional regulator
MLPFTVELRSGLPLFGQVVYAVKKALVNGQLRPGDRFPSVRTLSQELKINPNTAHKIVATLVHDGLLEVQPGVGTTIARVAAATRAQRNALLGDEVERLVVEAKRLGLELEDLLQAARRQWNRMEKE